MHEYNALLKDFREKKDMIAELKEEQTKELKKEFCEDMRLKAVREIADGVDFVYFLGAKELIRVKLESKDCE